MHRLKKTPWLVVNRAALLLLGALLTLFFVGGCAFSKTLGSRDRPEASGAAAVQTTQQPPKNIDPTESQNLLQQIAATTVSNAVESKDKFQRAGQARKGEIVGYCSHEFKDKTILAMPCNAVVLDFVDADTLAPKGKTMTRNDGSFIFVGELKRFYRIQLRSKMARIVTLSPNEPYSNGDNVAVTLVDTSKRQ